MDRREFYKELMSKNTFDSDKIKQAAKSKNTRSGYAPTLKWISIAGSVAVLTVAIGVTSMNIFFNNDPFEGPGISILNSDTNSDSGSITSNKDPDILSVKDVNVLVSFNSPLTKTQLEATESYVKSQFDLVACYRAQDNQRLSGNELENALSDGITLFSGCIFQGTENSFTELKDCNYVYSVDVLNDDEVFLALPKSFEQADVTNTDSQSENTQNSNSAQTSDITEDPSTSTGAVTTTANQPPVQTNPDITTIPDVTAGDDTDIISESDTETNDETSYYSTDIDIDTAIDDDPAEQQDPISEPQPGVKTITINTGSVNSAYFITDNSLITLTDNKAAIYNPQTPDTPVLQMSGTDPKVAWLSPAGNRLIISFCDNSGNRSILWLVNLAGNICNTVDVSVFGLDWSETDIQAIAYEEANGALILRTKAINSQEAQIIYSKLDFNTCKISEAKQLISTADKTSLLAISNNNLYYAKISSDGKTNIIRFNTANNNETIIKSYENTPKISRNQAFNCAVISPGEKDVIGFTEIFIAESETFTPMNCISDVYFSLDGKYFICNSRYYKVAGGKLSETNDAIAAAMIDYKNNMSSKYSISEIGSEFIKVNESLSSANNSADGDLPSMNSPNEIDETVVDEFETTFESELDISLDTDNEATICETEID